MLAQWGRGAARLSKQRTSRCGFSLLELMVVLGIIGMLAMLSMPAIRGIGQSNALAAAARQLQDDIGLARQKAISGRTTVFMVFLPPEAVSIHSPVWGVLNTLTPNQKKQFTNLLTGTYTSYALISTRSVGDQPGRATPHYITDWRQLPEGIFISTNKFNPSMAAFNLNNTISSLTNRPFAYCGTNAVPFPTAKSPVRLSLPMIGFNSSGQLIRTPQYQTLFPDEIIPLARGSIFFVKDAQGNPLRLPPDVREIPPGNSQTTPYLVYVDSMTGRSRVIRKEIQ
jgi:prepilin-type N-terminal cleavage/methylation domain-containing protein